MRRSSCCWPACAARRRRPLLRRSPARLAAIPQHVRADRRRWLADSGAARGCSGRTTRAGRSSRRRPSSTASVYVGIGERRAARDRPRDRQAEMEVPAASDDIGIGESSPAVGGGVVYIGDLDRRAARGGRRDRQGAMDVQDGRGDQVVAGRRRRSRVLIGSYDGNLYALDAATGKQLWKVGDRQLRARDAGDLERRRVLRRLRRVLPRRAH